MGIKRLAELVTVILWEQVARFVTRLTASVPAKTVLLGWSVTGVPRDINNQALPLLLVSKFQGAASLQEEVILPPQLLQQTHDIPLLDTLHQTGHMKHRETRGQPAHIVLGQAGR